MEFIMRYQSVAFVGAFAALMVLVSPAVNAGESSNSYDTRSFLPEVNDAIGVLPVTAPGPEVSLDQAIRMTGKRNVTLEMMRAEVEKAHWQMATSWALVMPMVTAGLDYVRADHSDIMNFDIGAMLKPFLENIVVPWPDTTSEPTVIRRVDDLKGSITVAMSLINVQSWFTISAARVGDDLAKLSYGQVREQLFSGVTQAYLAALMTKSVIGLQESQVMSAAHHLDFALKRFKAGSGLKIDVVRAEADLVQARQQLINAHLSYESARDALGLLSGMGGLPVPLPAPSLAVSGMSDENMVNAALSDRLDVKLSAAGLEFAKKDFGMSWAAYLPTVSGGWAGSYQFTEPASLGSIDKSRWNLFLGVDVPIFEFAKIGSIKQKKFAKQIAEFKLEDTKLAVAREVREASRQYRTAVANLEIAGKQAELATEALGLVEAAYQAGAGSSLEVTDARRNKSGAEVGALTARLKVEMALLALHVATGKKVTDLFGVSGSDD